EEFILEGVALGDEPRPAGQVVPPLPAHARLALAVEHVIGPLDVGCRRGVGHGADLAAEDKFLEGPRSVERAAQELHGWTSPSRSWWKSIPLRERSKIMKQGALLFPITRPTNKPTTLRSQVR